MSKEANSNRWFWKTATIILAIVALGESYILFDTYYIKSGSIRLDWNGGDIYELDSESRIIVSGSWIADSDNGVFAQYQQINASQILCDGSLGLCIEARAIKNPLNDNLLVQILEYQIKSWTPQEVVAVYERRAGGYEIHLNRAKKAVTMIDYENEEIEGARTLPAYAHLGCGEEAMKAAHKK